MLVLSRKTSEAIRIGDNIRIVLVRIGPNTARLGIEAPPQLNIVREELVVELESDLEPQAEGNAVHE